MVVSGNDCFSKSSLDQSLVLHAGPFARDTMTIILVIDGYQTNRSTMKMQGYDKSKKTIKPCLKIWGIVKMYFP